MRGTWVLGLVVVGCVSQPAASSDREAPVESPVVERDVAAVEDAGVPAVVEWAQPSVEDPGVPEIDRGVLLRAPEGYGHLTLRAGLPVGARYEDLVYEGNNKNFRGTLGAEGLYRDGDATAEDWRRWTAGVKGMIVLRDSLFSQQDHPVLQRPRALMMPPSWVSVAVAATMAGETLVAPVAPEVEDDVGWGAAVSVQARFGSFPPSERLFDEAKVALQGASAEQQARTRNARVSLRALAEAAAAMVQAQPGGPEVVAEAGAAWIAASDRAYFGAELRKRIIPIFVEQPNEHEARDEGKGMTVWGMTLPDTAVALARDTVYARRLADGPLGIERYDLRHADEQARAIALLEALIPRGSQGHPIWLWVNGGSDGHGHGDPATPYIPAFEEAIEGANIERSRLVLLSKPSPRPTTKAALDVYADQTRTLGIPASVQLNTRAARSLLMD